MKELFLVLLYLQTVVLTVIILKLLRIRSELSRRLRATIFSGICTCLLYSVNCFPVSAFVSHLCYGLYYISVSLLMMHLTLFVHTFTGIAANNRAVRIIESSIIVVDIVILIILSAAQKLITPLYVPVGGSYMWQPVIEHFYFDIHLGFCYLYSLVIICLFAIKIGLTSHHQRSKFLLVLWGLSLILITNALYLLTGWKFDISLFGYGLVSMLIYFFCFIYVPRDLVNVALINALSETQGMLICFDMDGNCVYFNETARNYLADVHQITRDYDNYCKNYFDRWGLEHPSFFTTENEVINRNMTANIDGQEHTFEVHGKRSFDDKGLYLGCYFNIIDRTQEYLEAQERELQRRVDPLSGFLSREYFFDQVRKTILQNPDTDYYLTCSNIVDFKIFNSIYGEEQGNQLLKKCAKAIENADTKMILMGRISGDLFGFLLEKEKFNERRFSMFVSNLQDEFSNAFYKMHIQYGLYPITNRNEPISSMCEKVTLSLKNHKSEMDRIIFFYDESDLGISLNEKKLLGRFDQALTNNEFTTFLQPQVTADGKLLGAEALVRWIEPDGTIVCPDSFVPLLERNGLISKVDLAMWNNAAQLLSRWAFMGREDLTISINISVKDFYYMDLYGELTALVEEYQINPKNLCLEITESIIISDLEHVNAMIQRLRDYGFTVEIDDFGSGYSSLGMLKDITVDVLKLDMTFIRMADSEKSERGWLIVEQILQMAKKLHMETIVEGVEDKDQLTRLTALGCDHYQGFYYAPPEPVEYFERRFQED